MLLVVGVSNVIAIPQGINVLNVLYSILFLFKASRNYCVYGWRRNVRRGFCSLQLKQDPTWSENCSRRHYDSQLQEVTIGFL